MTKLLTTVQVRNIMHANGAGTYGMYTNKTKGHTGRQRRVKCYFLGNRAALDALIAACSAENVTVTNGSTYSRSPGPGITVKCVLA